MDLESMSDNEISSTYTSESSCMLSMQRYETLEVSVRGQWEVSSELDEEVEPPAARHREAKKQKPQMTEEAATAVTTLMIQSMPTNLSQRDLVRALDVLGMDFDFLYMPSNFRTGAPHGYAFVNLTSAAAAAQLKALWGGRRPWGGAGRPLTVLPADLQGLEANARKWDTAKMRRVRNPEHRPLVRANRQIPRR